MIPAEEEEGEEEEEEEEKRERERKKKRGSKNEDQLAPLSNPPMTAPFIVNSTHRHLYPSKSRALSFTRARVKDPLNYTLRDKRFLKIAPANIWGSSYVAI